MLQISDNLQPSATRLEQLFNDLADGLDPTIENKDSGNLAIDGLPTPYSLQSEILQSPALRKIVASGRQVGKTVMATMSAIGGKEYGERGLLDGAQVHISSTTQDQSDLFWDYLTSWLGELIGTPGFYKNESRRIIRYRGGQIRVKTGRTPDTLRGGNVDKLILDECAYLDPDAWRKVGAPMLLARNGVAEFYSTPKRRNWFFQLFEAAKSNEDWEWWNFTTLANPHISEKALDMLVSDMTEDDYEQEILAKFLEGQGAVFRNIDRVATLQKRERYAGKFVFGVDWGKQQDYTVIVVMDIQTKQMVDYDRFNQIGWSLQRGRLINLYEKWNPLTIIAEQNSIGEPNIEALWAEDLPVEPFMTTAQSKSPLIESLVLAIEREEIGILDDDIIKGELMAYERTITKTGRSQYSAPTGLHDDCVIATALALYGVIENIGYGWGSAPIQGYGDFRG
jgi:hypothetical protein